MSSNKNVRRQGRRVVPVARNTVSPKAKKQLSLGDLVAAAFDALGDSTDVQRVLGSREMKKVIGRRIVFA